MPDLVELSFAALNTLLSFIGLVLLLIGVKRFKGGLLERALKRAIPAGILLFLYFISQALIGLEILPVHTFVDDVLGTLFMLGLLYAVYGFIQDWTHLENCSKNKSG